MGCFPRCSRCTQLDGDNYGYTAGCIEGGTDSYTDGYTDGHTDGYIDDYTDGYAQLEAELSKLVPEHKFLAEQSCSSTAPVQVVSSTAAKGEVRV